MIDILERFAALVLLLCALAFCIWSSNLKVESRAHQIGDKISLLGLRFSLVIFLGWMGLYGLFFSTPLPGLSKIVIFLQEVICVNLLIASPIVAIFFVLRTRDEIRNPEKPIPFI